MARTFRVPQDIKPGEGFKLAPAGTYACRITEKSDIKKVNDKLTLVVHGRVAVGSQKGVTFFDNIQLTKAVEWKLHQFLSALGFNVEKLKGKDIPLDKIVGRAVKVQLRQDSFGGRKRNKVGTYLRLEGGIPTEETETEEESGEELGGDDEGAEETDETDETETSDELEGEGEETADDDALETASDDDDGDGLDDDLGSDEVEEEPEIEEPAPRKKVAPAPAKKIVKKAPPAPVKKSVKKHGGRR